MVDADDIVFGVDDEAVLAARLSQDQRRMVRVRRQQHQQATSWSRPAMKAISAGVRCARR